MYCVAAILYKIYYYLLYEKKDNITNVMLKLLFQCVFLIVVVSFNKAHYCNNSIKRYPEMDINILQYNSIYLYIHIYILYLPHSTSFLVTESHSNGSRREVVLNRLTRCYPPPYTPTPPPLTTVILPFTFRDRSHPPRTFPCHFKLLLVVSYSESFYACISRILFTALRSRSQPSRNTRSNHFNLYTFVLSAAQDAGNSITAPPLVYILLCMETYSCILNSIYNLIYTTHTCLSVYEVSVPVSIFFNSYVYVFIRMLVLLFLGMHCANCLV